MQRHPYFDLWLHDDAELGVLLASPVVGRATLHEWPLSCVQRIRTADGRTRIYKVQAEPTVEPEFYSQAHSPLLVNAQIIRQASAPAALLLEDVTAPRFLDLQPTLDQALGLGRALLREIAHISGDLPAVADLRTEQQWRAYVAAMHADLCALVESGRFHLVDYQLIEHLMQTALAQPVLSVLCESPGYVHLDLSATNLFVLADGYRLIDWQRPIWGPTALDLASLLDSLHMELHPHLSSGVIQLFNLLRIGWLSQCARRWFPPGADSYDRQIVQLAEKIDQ
jgi:hypothetical protein